MREWNYFLCRKGNAQMIMLLQMQMIDKIGFFKRDYLWVFLLFLLLHLLPLFSVDVLVTLDGASHLYNAKLFDELLAGNDFIASFFEVNEELVPNYTGHLLLSFFLWFFSPIFSLKLLHILYVVGPSFAFRGFVLAFNPNGGLLSVLIFPLVYSDLFLNGFYNFSLAIVLLLFSFRYWVRNYQRSDVWFFISLSVLFFFTYLSHSFTFAFLCLSIGLFTLVVALRLKRFYFLWSVGGKVFLVALPYVLLAVSFVVKRKAVYGYLSKDVLWEKLTDMWCLSGLGSEPWFVVLWGVLLLLSLVVFVRFSERDDKGFLFFYLLLIAMVFYFYLPDSVGYASVFSERMLYFGFIFWALWLASQRFDFKLSALVVILLFLYQGYRVKAMMDWSVFPNNKAKEMMAIGRGLPQNSVVLPIRRIGVWHFFHLSNFMGVEQPMVILENYEASLDYFPIRWKFDLEKAIMDNCSFEVEHQGYKYKVDYLVVFGFGSTDDKCELERIEFAERLLDKVYQSDFAVVYKVR